MHATFAITIAVDLVHIVAINMSFPVIDRTSCELELHDALTHISVKLPKPHKILLLSRNYIRASVTAVTINRDNGGWWLGGWWDVTHNPRPRRILQCGGRVDWFFAPWRHNESSMRVMVKHGADIGTGACSFVLFPVPNEG